MDSARIIVDKNCKQISESICVRTIAIIAAINDRTVEDTIDTKVSSATCFSSLFWLSILPIIIVANPNRIGHIIENTVVNKFAKSSSTIKSSLYTSIIAISKGNTRKHSKSHSDVFFLFAFLKTCSCSFARANSRTFLLRNRIIIRKMAVTIFHIYLSFINILLRNNAIIVFIGKFS